MTSNSSSSLPANLPGGLTSLPGGAPAANPAANSAAKEAEAEKRQFLLSQILQQSAKERLDRISIVKPEKARAVEDLLINMAGQIRSIDENMLIDLLENVATGVSVTISRRRDFDDDNDDEYLNLL